mmetsp:Transcript_98921/g.277049  ORF Transcript_98921/g.277049 Transcript_98921/m.277049 type:complete len:156 (+) Transcript_98921:334-801(+)
MSFRLGAAFFKTRTAQAQSSQSPACTRHRGILKAPPSSREERRRYGRGEGSAARSSSHARGMSRVRFAPTVSVALVSIERMKDDSPRRRSVHRRLSSPSSERNHARDPDRWAAGRGSSEGLARRREQSEDRVAVEEESLVQSGDAAQKLTTIIRM